MVRIHHGTPKLYSRFMWPHHLMVRIQGFHPCHRGSNPLGVTILKFLFYDFYTFKLHPLLQFLSSTWNAERTLSY